MDTPVEQAVEPAKRLASLGTQALEDLYNNMASAKEFVLAQAPDVCREIVNWQIAQGIVSLVIWLVCIAALAVAAYVFRNVRDNDGDRVVTIVAGLVAGIGGTITLALIVLPALLKSVQAYVAPKLVVMQYIHEMLK